jgi:hypothetical protein
MGRAGAEAIFITGVCTLLCAWFVHGEEQWQAKAGLTEVEWKMWKEMRRRRSRRVWCEWLTLGAWVVRLLWVAVSVFASRACLRVEVPRAEGIWNMAYGLCALYAFAEVAHGAREEVQWCRRVDIGRAMEAAAGGVCLCGGGLCGEDSAVHSECE